MGLLVRWYITQLKRHQFSTNMVTTGAIFLMGDVVAQQLIERRGKSHDAERTARSAGIGAVYSAPLAVFSYNVVDRIFGKSTSPFNTLKKIGFMFIFTPFTNGGYLSINNLLQHKTWEETSRQLSSDLGKIVLGSYSVWLPTNFLLLTLVPLRHRVLVSNGVGVLWTSYLTYVANGGQHGWRVRQGRELVQEIELGCKEKSILVSSGENVNAEDYENESGSEKSTD